MTIEEIKQGRDKLSEDIERLVHAFEIVSGCVVDRVELRRSTQLSGQSYAHVSVEVRLP